MNIKLIGELRQLGINIKTVKTPMFVIGEDAYKVENMPFKSIQDAANELNGTSVIIYSIQEMPVEGGSLMTLIRGKQVTDDEFNQVIDYDEYLSTEGVLSGINDTKGVPKTKQ